MRGVRSRFLESVSTSMSSRMGGDKVELGLIEESSLFADDTLK